MPARKKRKGGAAATKRGKSSAARPKKPATTPKKPAKRGPRRAAAAEALRPIRLRINNGDANWNLLGELRGPTRIIPDVAVRRARPADQDLEPGVWHYDFDATGGSGGFELEALLMPQTSLAKDNFDGPDVLRFVVP
jgi:hypothetical protein